jgi:hypothetical protein
MPRGNFGGLASRQKTKIKIMYINIILYGKRIGIYAWNGNCS